MPKEITAYECEYGCGFYLKTKKSVEKHEARCFWNPKRRACASCAHNVPEWITVYNPHHGGDPGSTDYDIKSYYCDAYDRSLDGNLKYDCELWERKEEG